MRGRNDLSEKEEDIFFHSCMIWISIHLEVIILREL